MIVTVTPNPCLDEDFFLNEESLTPGTIRVPERHRYPGGKGIDVSRAIHACGGRSVATGFIGGHIGNLVVGLLAIEGIECDFVQIRDETRTNVICHLAGGDEIRLNTRGPSISGDEYLGLVGKILSLGGTRAGIVAGSVCAGMEPIHSCDMLLAAFKQRNDQCITFLDTGEHHTMAALSASWPPDFIKPNIYEFHNLLRVRVNSSGIAPDGVNPQDVNEEQLISTYCKCHRDLGEAWELLISRMNEFNLAFPRVRLLLTISKFGVITLEGSQVSLAFYGGTVQCKTTVGAGDAFNGGFVTSYVVDEPRNLGKALQAGVAASTARVQGQHREFGYMDQETLQSVRGSQNLQLWTFERGDIRKRVGELSNLFGGLGY